MRVKIVIARAQSHTAGSHQAWRINLSQDTFAYPPLFKKLQSTSSRFEITTNFLIRQAQTVTFCYKEATLLYRGTRKNRFITDEELASKVRKGR
jgi:hypothetical protein